MKQSVKVRSPRGVGAKGDGKAQGKGEGVRQKPGKLKRGETSASLTAPSELKRSGTSPDLKRMAPAPASEAIVQEAAASASTLRSKEGKKKGAIVDADAANMTIAEPTTPLMIAAVPLRARKDVANSSPLVGPNHAVAAGSLFYIVEQQELVEKERGELLSPPTASVSACKSHRIVTPSPWHGVQASRYMSSAC